jgi:hypothetical protein
VFGLSSSAHYCPPAIICHRPKPIMIFEVAKARTNVTEPNHDLEFFVAGDQN